MAVETGGGARGWGGGQPPTIFCQPIKINSLRITTYKSVYSNKANIGSYLSGFWKSQIF